MSTDLPFRAAGEITPATATDALRRAGLLGAGDTVGGATLVELQGRPVAG